MNAAEFAKLLRHLKIIEEGMNAAISGDDSDMRSAEGERRDAVGDAVSMVGSAINRMTDRAYADAHSIEQEVADESGRASEAMATIWARRAEERSYLHLDWKKDVRAVAKWHCQGVDIPAEGRVFCKEWATWEVDDINYCDRHLVLSER